MTATTSTVKTTQKQYTTTPKTIITSSPQTSVMKQVGTSTSQNQKYEYLHYHGANPVQILY